VAAWCETRTAFASSNGGVVGSWTFVWMFLLLLLIIIILLVLSGVRAEALRWADLLSTESYQLCITLRN
jgi:hypothetical protein